MVSDYTKNGGDFALFRKVCSPEYDGSLVKQKYRHYSAVGSHYLKVASAREGTSALVKVRKQIGSEEWTERKPAQGVQVAMTERKKPKGKLVRHKVYANALYDIDRREQRKSSNAESHAAVASIKTRDESDAMFFKSLVKFNGELCSQR